MPLQELAAGKRVVGARSVYRKLIKSEIIKVFVARDAEKKVIESVLKEAKARGIPVEWADDSKILGRACLIERPAAVAGLLIDRRTDNIR